MESSDQSMCSEQATAQCTQHYTYCTMHITWHLNDTCTRLTTVTLPFCTHSLQPAPLLPLHTRYLGRGLGLRGTGGVGGWLAHLACLHCLSIGRTRAFGRGGAQVQQGTSCACTPVSVGLGLFQGAAHTHG